VLKLFTAGSYAASTFSSIVFPGTTSYDASRLTVDGTIKVTGVPSTLPSTPTNLTFSVSAGQLHLLWPPDYTGWLLQSNAVGVANSNFWYSVPGAGLTSELFLNLDLSQTNVFYRMLHP
jgi:hypothetical protein